MKFENTKAYNFDGAIRGMRNPMSSWDRSDSRYTADGVCVIGSDDLALMQKLIKAGSEHRKFMRQIMVSVDITAPLYWWKEADTYKVGTVANSTSTMHKLANTQISLDCFEYVEMYNLNSIQVFQAYINSLEALRQLYNSTQDKRYWKELIIMLPESWLQTRTVTMNYENVLSMYHQRRNHKLTEWSVDFVKWVESLPYSEELITGIEGANAKRIC